MLPEKKIKTNIGVGIGIILEIAANVLSTHHIQPLLALVCWLLGAFFFVWGCMNYAEGKGHSKLLGLLGLLSCIGLIVLIFLPDNRKEIK
jgi:hypothetical protein